MSDQFNNFDNQHNDSNKQNPEQPKGDNSDINNDQNQYQSQGQNPYQDQGQNLYQQSMNPNENNRQDGYRHYTYGDSSYRIYRDPNVPNNNQSEPNRYPMNNEVQGTQDTESEKIRRIVKEEINNAKPKHRFLRAVALVLVGVILATGGTYTLFATGVLGQQNIEEKAQVEETQSTTSAQPINVTLDDNGTVENTVATKAIPSIVGVTALVKGKTTSYFFDNQIPQYAEAIGSGVIIDSNGYILTNSHVVSDGDAEKLTVSFTDDEDTEATLIWYDQTLDLAIIKVDKTGLSAIELGDSDEVKVGDKAIAVGNPFGLDLQSTLTSGYISGLNRTIQVEDGNILDGLIQTDAAINSGNSGGALLNMYGEVVGINTARSETADGIGFSIPINVVKPVIEEIKANGEFESVYIGISGANVQVISAMTNQELPAEKGVVIDIVSDNSPAAKAGLKSGDIIYEIDGHAVDSMNSLKAQLLTYREGDKAEISIYRDNEQETVEIEFTAFSFNSIVG